MTQPSGASAMTGPSAKSRLVAFLLCTFAGWSGAHRLYAGRKRSGLIILGGTLCGLGAALAMLPAAAAGQTALAGVLGLTQLVLMAGLAIWVTVDWFVILLGKFRDGAGRRMSAWSAGAKGATAQPAASATGSESAAPAVPAAPSAAPAESGPAAGPSRGGFGERIRALLGPLAGTRQGLVIRTNDVEVIAVRGAAVATRVRVPLGGTEQRHLVQAVQQSMETALIKTRRLAVAIPTQDVLFRFFSMPVIPKGELENAVQFEARKYIPFKTEGLMWDYHTSQNAATGKLDVVFAAIPKDTFQALQDALAAAGVEPTIIEPRTLSLARLAAYGQPSGDNEFVCIVDVEGDQAHIAITRNRIPYLARDISLQVRSDLMDAYGTTAGVGEVLTRAKTGPEMDRRQQRLVSELNVSVDFLMREYPSAKVAKILLFGEDRVLEPWCAGLAERFHCPAELGTALLQQCAEGDVPLAFGSAVGLVQPGADSRRCAIDFLRRSRVKPSGEAALKAAVPDTAEILTALKTPQVAVSCVVAAGLLLAMFVAMSQWAPSVQRQLERMMATRPDVGWGLNQLDQEAIGPVRDQAQARVTFMKRVNEGRLLMASKMDALVRTLPEGVWLTRLTTHQELSPMGSIDARLTIAGACYLGEAGRELRAIQEFERDAKENPILAKGFKTIRVEEITSQVEQPSGYGSPEDELMATYRTFQLQCNSNQTM